MTMPPRSGMVLAAGLGTRLRPVTETIPKPLVEINGRSLLDHAIDRLALAGGRARRRQRPLQGRDGSRTARPPRPPAHRDLGRSRAPRHRRRRSNTPCRLLDDTFFVVNGDVFWLDGKDHALLRLAGAFDPDHIDAILLLQRTVTAVGYEGNGDYFLDTSGKPHRRGEREVAPYLFAGIQLLHRRLFDGMPDRIFSLVRLFDRAEQAGRLHAIVHDGEWYHIVHAGRGWPLRANGCRHKRVVSSLSAN